MVTPNSHNLLTDIITLVYEAYFCLEADQQITADNFSTGVKERKFEQFSKL